MRHPWRLAAAGLCLLAVTALSVERSAPAPAQCARLSPPRGRPPILDDLLAAQPPPARAALAAAAPGTPASAAGTRGRRRGAEAGDLLPHQRG